jgi:chromosome segregation ATPase
LSLEAHFNRQSEEKRRLDDDYKARLEANLVFIANLRNEIDDNKNLLNDRRKQNSDFYVELERSKESIDARSVEISRLRVDVQSQQDLLQSLQHQRKQLEEELYAVRERNRDDAQEIDKLNLVND